MKKIKIYLSFLAMFALLFTSCSKDESSNTTNSDKATLTFGAIVADLAAKSTEKQSAIGDMPACSDDTPAYVEIVLMQGDNEVVGTTADPYRVDLVPGQIFTKEDAALELTPGTYSLDHFSVYNAAGDLLWLAPKGEGVLAQFVDNSLPIAIELGAGVKKYVDVSVLCYDDRDVNLYGYQFFELDINEAFEFCFFANYCTPEGRHYPARYSVDISIDGTTLYEGVVNNTGRNNDGDLYAEALCFALPNLEAYENDEEYIDYTLTLLDWTEEDDAYGDVEQKVITGSLSRAEIMANFDGDDDVEYEHFRFGCGDDDQQPVDTDSDGDGVLDGNDNCPNTPEGATVDENGCPMDSDNDGVWDGIDQCSGTESGVEVDAVGCAVDTGETCENLTNACELEVPTDLGEYCFVTYVNEADSDGWIKVDDANEFELLYEGLEGPEALSEVSFTVTNGEVTFVLDTPIATEDRITAYAIQISPSNEDGNRSTSCWESSCAEIVGDEQYNEITDAFSGFQYEYPFYVKVSTVSCFSPDVFPGE